jgi:hypothetical protein
MSSQPARYDNNAGFDHSGEGGVLSVMHSTPPSGMLSQHGGLWQQQQQQQRRSSQVMHPLPMSMPAMIPTSGAPTIRSYTQPNQIELTMPMLPPSTMSFQPGAYGFDLSAMSHFPIQQPINFKFNSSLGHPASYSQQTTDLTSTVPLTRNARTSVSTLNRPPTPERLSSVGSLQLWLERRAVGEMETQWANLLNMASQDFDENVRPEIDADRIKIEEVQHLDLSRIAKRKGPRPGGPVSQAYISENESEREDIDARYKCPSSPLSSPHSPVRTSATADSGNMSNGSMESVMEDDQAIEPSHQLETARAATPPYGHSVDSPRESAIAPSIALEDISETSSHESCWSPWMDSSTEDELESQPFPPLLKRLRPELSALLFHQYTQTIGCQAQNPKDCGDGSQKNHFPPQNSNNSNSNEYPTSNSKRKSTNKRKRDEDPNEDNGDQPYRKRSQTKCALNGKHRLLACPFCKHNPIKYRKCYGKTLKEINRLKYVLKQPF